MKVVAIKSIADVSSGNTPSRRKSEYWNGSIPWITTGELESGYVTASKECVTEKALKETALKLYHKGTVLIAMYGQGKTRGTAAVLGIEATVNQACAALTVHSGCSKFLFYQLQNSYHAIRRLSNTGNQENLNAGIIKNFKILWPDELEQQKIATILSTQDKVIELKEKLLAQKQQQKKYLMQQLLTGRKPHKNNPRIEECEIGEVCKINPKQDKISESQVVFLGMADISETGSVVSQRLVDFSHIQSGFTAFRRGDILIAKITPCFENGKGAYTDNLLSEHGFGSTEFHVLRTNSKVNAKYIFYHTVSEKFRKKLEREMTGSAGQKRVPAISIQKYKIFLPSSNEQNFIIEILSTADHEIDLLQKSIDAEKQKKKALMQLLLTGKVRVKI